MRVGCCGWGYLDANQFFGLDDWRKKYKHKLQAYADVFDLVEVNSTFYRIPRVSTAEGWRALVDELNERFEFTVKCSKIITHEDRFEGEDSLRAYGKIAEIAKALRAEIVLFQTPASYRNEEENVETLRSFFRRVDRGDLVFAWEPRGKSWFGSPGAIRSLCQELDLVHCTDPFNVFPVAFSSSRIPYLRLHGKPPGKQMYRYAYRDEDLAELRSKLSELKGQSDAYVLFNNTSMYDDARRFREEFAPATNC